MILTGIRCIGFIICSPHSICLNTEGLMGLATDNILGLTDGKWVVLAVSGSFFPDLRHVPNIPSLHDLRDTRLQPD